MKRILSCVPLALAVLTLSQSVSAQENLLAEKPIFTLGPAKTWTGNDGEKTFNVEDLSKIVAVPTNTSNVFLFYEGGGFNTEENREIGIQGFYIDMESEQEVAVVSSTWEGAAASAYEIYLTNEEPTLAILETNPTYSASGLGQYTSNKADLPAGSKGRYLVFQPTDATNYGWGVKIRSISAIAPYVSELTSFSVSPSMALLNSPVPVSFTFLNQLGDPIDASEVTVTVSDNATYTDGVLTINEGTEAVFTAKMADKELTFSVSAIFEAPAAPGVYKTAIFLSNNEDLDATVDLMTGYNGGAKRLDNVRFPDGEVALAFADLRCVFFGNKETLGAWGTKFAPAEHNFRAIHLSVYPTKDVNANINFEGAGDRVNNYVQLEANKWNEVEVGLVGIENINNYSLRLTEADMCDVLVTNVYFTPTYVEGDENAPELETLTAVAGTGAVTLTLKATDDLNNKIDYTIAWGEDHSVTFEGNSGEEVTYVVENLNMNTEYTFSVTVSDGLNVSEPQTIDVKTLGIEDAPVVEVDEELYSLVAVFGYSFGLTDIPGFDAWGSTGRLGSVATNNGQNVMYFTNYLDQWGGLNLDKELDGCTTLHIDLMPFEAPEASVITVAPVWSDANGVTTPDKTVNLVGGEWNHIELPLSDFAFPKYGTKVGQFAVNHPNFSTFAIGNFYFTGLKEKDGVELVGAENGPVEFFNLQGVRVSGDLTPGLYIRRENGRSSKVVVK